MTARKVEWPMITLEQLKDRAVAYKLDAVTIACVLENVWLIGHDDADWIVRTGPLTAITARRLYLGSDSTWHSRPHNFPTVEDALAAYNNFVENTLARKDR